MLISDQQYLAWQKKLVENKFFRRFWVFWGIYISGLFAVGNLAFFFKNYRMVAILGWAAFLLARFVILEIIYFFYKRPRPCQRLNFHPPISIVFISWVNKRFDSFPSGHAASLAAISTAVFFFIPFLGFLGFIATILNGVGRGILGYHYISDVLAGWILGVFTAFITIHWLLSLVFTR
jgi:membrane-associated phospholipid phosphatase